MIVYIIFFLVLVLLSRKIKGSKYSIFDYITLFVLILLSALRYGIGSDYYLYEAIYNTRGGLDNYATNRTGAGFSQVMYFFRNSLEVNFQIFVAVVAIITIISFYLLYKKNSKNPGLAIMAYVAMGFYTASFNAMRQFLSVSLAIYSIELYKDNKKLLAAMMAVSSILLHSSTAILLIGYIIVSKFKTKTIKPSIAFGISVILYVAYDVIFGKVIGLFKSYSGYESYESTPGVGTYLIVLCQNLIYYLIITKNRHKLSAGGQKFYNLVSIGIIITSLQLKNWLFARIAQDFLIFMPIILADILGDTKEKNKKIVNAVVYACAIVYFLVYVKSFGGVVPYDSVFSIGVAR